MAIGKCVLKEYRFNDGDAVITVLEGEEVMIEVKECGFITVEDLHELAEWINDKATTIATKFATGEFPSAVKSQPDDHSEDKKWGWNDDIAVSNELRECEE